MNWLRSLFASNDSTADSLIVGGLASLLSLCAIAAWDVGYNHREFSPIAFGGGAAAIITAIGGGKGLRARLTPAGDPPMLPEKPSDVIAAANAEQPTG